MVSDGERRRDVAEALGHRFRKEDGAPYDLSWDELISLIRYLVDERHYLLGG